MFANISVAFIRYLIVLSLIVFFFRIALSYYNKLKKRKMDSELDSKIDSYFKQHISNTKIEYEDSCDYKVVGHPKLHLLRLVQSGNNITIYFSNRGDKVFNIDVTSSDVLSISIEPKDNILDNTTGCIKFMTNNISDNKITFILNYTDGKLNSVSKKYLISILDKKMEEVY